MGKWLKAMGVHRKQGGTGVWERYSGEKFQLKGWEIQKKVLYKGRKHGNGVRGYPEQGPDSTQATGGAT